MLTPLLRRRRPSQVCGTFLRPLSHACGPRAVVMCALCRG